MLELILLFIVFGILGWIIDTAYRFVVDKKYAPGTWLRYFSIIFATGGIMLYVLFTDVIFAQDAVSALYQIILGWASLVLLEFFGGMLTVAVLNRRLWDYSKNRGNLLGHIDIFHSLCWMVLTVIFYMIVAFVSL